MRLLLVQTDIAWQSPGENFPAIEGLLRDAEQPFDVCILPEMFSTGFTMAPAACPRDTGQRSVDQLKTWSRTYDAAFCASTVYPVAGGFANRMFLVAAGEVLGHYDKRHLFRPAGESEAYVAGEGLPPVVAYRGCRFLLQVCYDLRFPVAANNVGDRYDVALYVASWPSARGAHWTALLRARAIENQAYVAGVNRVGADGNGFVYSGDTAAFGPLGDALAEGGAASGTTGVTLDLDGLRDVRQRLPFLRDADRFTLHDARTEVA